MGLASMGKGKGGGGGEVHVKKPLGMMRRGDSKGGGRWICGITP